MRATWSGSISFGLVNVPVKLYSAVSEKDVKFNMLHDACGSRINLKRFCANEGVEVPNEHIVKGYEIAKGRYVTVTDEEIEAADPKGGHVIEIEEFVGIEQIDPIYFDRTYYVGPDKGAGKAYGLLLAAMRKAGKVGMARLTLRTKQQLCCVRPHGTILAVTTMNYADEINRAGEIDAAAPEPAPREMDMAVRLLEAQTVPFDPARYHDTHRERVLALIERKAAGETITAPAVPGLAPVIDLAAALEASLAAAKGKAA